MASTLSLVGRATRERKQFDLFGKVGTTYGRTRTSGASGLGVQTGRKMALACHTAWGALGIHAAVGRRDRVGKPQTQVL